MVRSREQTIADDREPVLDTDMASLVVADFNGDVRADLAKNDGDGWSWLRTGTTTWAPLRGSGEQPEYADIRAALFGRFTAIDRRLDAIRYASPRFAEEFGHGFALWNGAGDGFGAWTPAWQEMR